MHKEDTPLRPIVSSIGSATYETAKELSRILMPLVGRSTHHVRNNQDFIQSIQDITIGRRDCMMSFDVKSLFTSIPIQPTLNIIKKLLGRRYKLAPENNNDSQTHPMVIRILPHQHIFFLSRKAV